MQWLIAFSIVVVAITLCIVMGVLCFRLLAGHTSRPIDPTQAQFALVAGSIALFGVLITGVFVITTFRVDTGARQIAMQAADEGVNEIAEQIVGQLAERVLRESRNEILGEAVIRAEDAIHTEDDTPQDAENQLMVGYPLTISVDPDTETRFDLLVEQEGTYRIDAKGLEGFDPFLYVYSITPEGPQLERVDDDGGEDFDSRVEMELHQGVRYFAQVAGYLDSTGECVLSLSRVTD